MADFWNRYGMTNKEDEEKDREKNNLSFWERYGTQTEEALPSRTKTDEPEPDSFLGKLAQRGVTIELPEPEKKTEETKSTGTSLLSGSQQAKSAATNLFTERLGQTAGAERAKQEKAAAQEEEKRRNETVRNQEWLDSLRSAEDIQKDLDAVKEQQSALDKKAFKDNALGVWYDLVGQTEKKVKANEETRAAREGLSERQKALEDELAERKWADYERLRDSEDFAEKSQPRELTTKERLDDPLYDYINGDRSAGMMLMDATDVIHGKDTLVAEQMTPEEIRMYNYIHATEGKDAAEEYVEFLKPELNARNMQDVKESVAGWTNQNAGTQVLGTVGSIALSPLKGLAYGGQVTDLLTTGKIDTNAPYNMYTAIPNTMRQTVSDNIEKKWGKWGSFAYQTGMSMADFLLNAGISGGTESLSLAIMGSGAAADATISAKERGLSDAQSFIIGSIAGAAEIASEKISFEKLFKNADLREAPVKYILQNIFFEGSEEVESDVINWLADAIVAQDKSEWRADMDAYKAENPKATDTEAFWEAVKKRAIEGGMDFLGGAISGGLMAGGGVTIDQAAKRARQNQDRSQDIEAARSAAQAAPKVNAPVSPVAAAQTQAAEEGSIVLPTEAEAARAEGGGGELRMGAEPSGNLTPTAEEAELEERIRNARNVTEATGIRYGVDEKTIRQAEKYGRATGREVEFYLDEGENGTIQNGYYDPVTGKIFYNAKAKEKFGFTFGHEFTHSLEGTQEYNALMDLAKQRTMEQGGDWAQKRQETAERYDRAGIPLTGEQIDQELTADWIGNNLSDEKTIREICRENPSLAKQVRDTLDNFITRLANMQGVVTTYEEKKWRNVVGVYDKYMRQIAEAEEAPAQTEVQKSAKDQNKEWLAQAAEQWSGIQKGELARTENQIVQLAKKTLEKNADGTYNISSGEAAEKVFQQVQAIARELVENANVREDNELAKQYDEPRKYLRETPIHYNRDTLVAERGGEEDFKEWRKGLRGILNLTSEEGRGLPIDTVFDEFAELYPGYVELTAEQDTDRLDQLAKVAQFMREQVKSSYVNPYEQDIDGAVNEMTVQLWQEATRRLNESAKPKTQAARKPQPKPQQTETQKTAPAKKITEAVKENETAEEYLERMGRLYDAGEISEEEYNDDVDQAAEMESTGHGISSSTVERDQGPEGKIPAALKRITGRYSISEDERTAQIQSEAFKNWFGDWENDPENASKVVNADGTPKVVYHGTARADRVGNVFLPERATSGPMAYFTDSEQIASNYARDKADTSLAYEEDHDGSYESQFRVRNGEKDIRLVDAWNRLSMRDRLAIREAVKHVTWDEDMENIVYDENAQAGTGGMQDYRFREHRGNAIAALVDEWLNDGNLYGNEEDFMDAIRLAGIPEALERAGLGEAYYDDPDFRDEKVYGVYLNIRNPFVTTAMDEDFPDRLEEWWDEQDQEAYERDYNAADEWDKNRWDMYDWIDRLRSDVENGTTHVWTTIPDAVTDYLKSLGYDGIEDQGGKYHDEGHTVYIPFASTQIKSETDNVGTFNPENPDIRYSVSENETQWSESPQFSRAIDDWSKRGKENGETLIIGSTPDVIQGLGAMDQDIYIETDKVNEILRKHKSMSLDEIKKIPVLLKNPVLILKSRSQGVQQGVNSRLAVLGTVTEKNNKPVIAILDLHPYDTKKGLYIEDMQKINSAYPKDKNEVSFLGNSDVMYADEKRTAQLLHKMMGFQAPIEATGYGSVGSITYDDENVNMKGVKFTDIFPGLIENATKNRQYSVSDDTEDIGAIASLPTVKLRDNALRAENQLAASLAGTFGVSRNRTTDTYKQFRREIVRPIVEAMIQGQPIDADGIFRENWSGSLTEGQKARADFDDAMAEAYKRVRHLTDKAEEMRAEEEAKAVRDAELDSMIPDTTEELVKLGEKYKDAKKRRAAVMARLVLTEEDQKTVEDLVAGRITDEEAYARNPYGIDDILQAAEAERAFRNVDAAWGRYTRRLAERRTEEADRAIENADSWNDKGTGIAYARETPERNFRDIAGKDAPALIDKYIRPVHTAEAASTRFKNDYIKRVKDLDLSRKVAKGNKNTEAEAVQFLGEAEDNVRVLERMRNPAAVRDGQTLDEWRSAIEQFRQANPNLDYAKIDRAIKEFGTIYGELIEQMNRVLVENGYEPVNIRRGYFPHFNGGDDVVLAKFASLLGIKIDSNALPTSINGLTSSFKPGKAWFGHAQERTGFRTDYDAVQGFEGYIGGVSDVIHQTTNIRNLRALSNRIRYKMSDEAIRNRINQIEANDTLTTQEKDAMIQDLTSNGRYKLSSTVAWLDEYTNLLANKKSKYDRTVEDWLGRGIYTWMKNIEGRVAANMIAGNLGSALTNFIPLNQAAAMIGDQNIIKGAAQTMANRINGDDFVNRSDFLTNRRGVDPLIQNRADKISEFLSKPMNIIDDFASEAIVRGAYNYYRKGGMDEESALAAADEFAAGVMADRSKGALPTIFGAKDPLIKLLTQFQVEVNNEFSTIFKDVPKGLYRNDKDRKNMVAVAAWTLMRYFIGAYLFNDLYESVVGRRAALDPVDILNDTVGDLTGKKLNNVIDMLSGEGIVENVQRKNRSVAIKNLRKNVLEELPFAGGLLGGGRIPISSAFPDWDQLENALWNENWDTKKRLQVGMRELGGSLGTYILPPFGGGVLKKAVQTAENTIAGGRFVKNAEGQDQLQYPYFTDTPAETAGTVAKSLFFGPTATEGGRDWVEGGFGSQSAKVTSLYKTLTQDLGESQRAAWDLIQTINSGDYGRDTQAKREAIAESDLTDEGKAAAMETYMSESEGRKFRGANEYGVTADVWTALYGSMGEYDENYNNTYSQKEINVALENITVPLSGSEGMTQGLFGGSTDERYLTEREKAVLWAAYGYKKNGKSWKQSNNPYDPDLGEQVIDWIDGLVYDEEEEEE